MLRSFVHAVVDGRNLTADEAGEAVRLMMSGDADPAQIAALLVALRMKGEAVSELVGGARALRSRCDAVTLTDEAAVDTCGTGGDGLATFNISTGAAFVVAGAGVPVAKHGNRAVSSKSGSADVLESLGAELSVPIERQRDILAASGFCFLFAPAHHAAARHVAPIRRALGLRTLFNLLGPLANPAGVRHQCVGVFAKSWTRPMAEALGTLGADCAAVVCADDGMDEVSPIVPSTVVFWEDGAVREERFDPASHGIRGHVASDLTGGDADENAAALVAVLEGKGRAAYADAVVLNAALALRVVKGIDWPEAIAAARDAIASGAAREAVRAYVKQSRG